VVGQLCHGADETVEHLVFQCPAHDHARRDTWPGDSFTTDPRRLWSYLERIGAVTPPTGNERERERGQLWRAPTASVGGSAGIQLLSMFTFTTNDQPPKEPPKSRNTTQDVIQSIVMCAGLLQ